MLFHNSFALFCASKKVETAQARVAQVWWTCMVNRTTTTSSTSSWPWLERRRSVVHSLSVGFGFLVCFGIGRHFFPQQNGWKHLMSWQCTLGTGAFKDTVIPELFVRDLISYISYFRLKVRNLVANERHARIQVYVSTAESGLEEHFAEEHLG